MNFPLVLLTLACFKPAFAQTGDGHSGHATSDEDAVKAVIVSGYIEGMHINRDAEAAIAAFHEDFVMHARVDGEVIQVTIDQWVSRLGDEKNEDEITYEFKSVIVTSSTANAVLEVFENGPRIYTDYFGLYKGDDGWKIMNKIYQSHE